MEVIDYIVSMIFVNCVDVDRLVFCSFDRRFYGVDARWLTGGVGGFLFDGVVLRTNFWINPPLR
jgi:hypothetical protein